MITAQVEKFIDNVLILRELFPLHYKELALDQDKVPLAPDWNAYIESEDAGRLIFMTLRQDGEMVGYFIGFIGSGLHYSTCLECKMDIFFIHPKARGEELPGLKLFRALEQELKRRGVQRWFVGSKMHASADALFKRLGFKPIEVYHSKWLGE